MPKLYLNHLEALRSNLALKTIQEYGVQANTKAYSAKEKELPTQYVRELETLEQGCLLHIIGYDEPMRGALAQHRVLATTTTKKLILLVTRYLLGKKTFFDRPTLFRRISLAAGLLINYDFYIDFIWYALHDCFYDNADRYAQPVREIYRVLVEFPKEREILCTWIENDMAYRYRLQHVIVKLNKEAFRKNPIKEIERLFGELMAQESGMQEKWNNILKVVGIALRLCKIFRNKTFKKICQAVEDINLDEMKSSKEDIYWQKLVYKDYKFN